MVLGVSFEVTSFLFRNVSLHTHTHSDNDYYTHPGYTDERVWPPETQEPF